MILSFLISSSKDCWALKPDVLSLVINKEAEPGIDCWALKPDVLSDVNPDFTRAIFSPRNTNVFAE